jgi:uncharacterized membrane protein (DUF485 family)
MVEDKGHGAWDKAFETGKGNWEKAYESDLYKKVVRKRFGFVVPAIITFCLLFFILFTVQHFFKDLANAMVIGNMNFNFLYTMLLFPVLWLIGLIFLRYVRKNVYPLEDEIIEKFGTKKGE